MCEEEASVAAVIRLSVLRQNVGEVQVSIQTHGHSLVLSDGTHSYEMQEEQTEVKDLNLSELRLRTDEKTFRTVGMIIELSYCETD